MADNMNFYAKLWLRDDTGAGSRSARRNIQSIADQLRNLQRIGVALFAARAFFAPWERSIGAVIAATVEQEQALKQVESRIRATGGAAGLAVHELADMAASLQGVTTYGDESILSMQSLLLSFRNIRGVQFRDATESVLDLATGLGVDLRSAAIQVGKALNDPTRGLEGLSRSGTTFSKAQEQTIKSLAESGRLAEAQALIIAELKQQYGGAGRAARDTFGGALEALGKTLGDLLEGKAGLRAAQVAVEDLNSAFKDAEALKLADTVILATAKAVGLLASNLGLISDTVLAVGVGQVTRGVLALGGALSGAATAATALRIALSVFGGKAGLFAAAGFLLYRSIRRTVQEAETLEQHQQRLVQRRQEIETLEARILEIRKDQTEESKKQLKELEKELRLKKSAELTDLQRSEADILTQIEGQIGKVTQAAKDLKDALRPYPSDFSQALAKDPGMTFPGNAGLTNRKFALDTQKTLLANLLQRLRAVRKAQADLSAPLPSLDPPDPTNPTNPTNADKNAAQREAALDRLRKRREEEGSYQTALYKTAGLIRYEMELRKRGGEDEELLQAIRRAGVKEQIASNESVTEFYATLGPGARNVVDAERERLRLARELKKLAEEDATRGRFDQETDNLRHEIALLGRTSSEQTILNRLRQLGAERTIAQGESLRDYIASLPEELQGIGELLLAYQRLAEAQDPVARLRERLAASNDWTDGIREGLRRLAEDTRSAAEEWADVTEGAAQRMSASLTEFVRSGKLNFSGLVDYIIQESIRLSVVDPLIKGLAGALGNLFGGGGAADPVVLGDYAPGLKFHTGGIVGEGPHRWPRFHGGGLASGEVPAILKRGEGVFTREQMGALAPAGPQQVEIRLVNQGAPKRAEVASQQMDGRTLVLGVLMQDLVERGDYSTALERTMGLRRVTT